MQHTFLTENFSLGITDPNFVQENADPGLAPYDLTHGGHPFLFSGHTDIKEYAVYFQDSITLEICRFRRDCAGISSRTVSGRRRNHA